MQGRIPGILEYGATKSLVEIEINNIKSIGIDTCAYESKFESIQKDVQAKLSFAKESSEEDKTRNINKVYSYGIEKLNLLLTELSKNKIFFQTMNKCMCVFDSQNICIISSIELSNIADDVIKSMKIIKSSSDFIEEQDVIDKLYELIFNVIKLEYRTNGSSKIMDYCKNDKIDAIYISKCVIKEIENIKLENYDTTDIDSLINKLNSSDDGLLYLNENLLLTISHIKDSKTYTSELIRDIEEMSAALLKNNEAINNLDIEEGELLYDKKHYISELERKRYWNNYNIKKPFIVLGVTASVLTCLISAGINFAKGTDYMTTVETYSSDTGKLEKEEEFRRELKDFETPVTELTTINVYEPWIENEKSGVYERTVKTVDISEIDYDDIKQYLDIDLESLGYEYHEYSETKELLTPEDIYTENIEEVIRQEQDVNVSQEGTADITETPGLFVISMFVSVIYLTFAYEAIKEDFTFGIIQSIRKIIEAIKERADLSYDKEEILNITNKIVDVKKQIDTLINENEKTKEKYNEIMKRPENKRLLDNCEEGIRLLQEYAEAMQESDQITLNRREKETQ